MSCLYSVAMHLIRTVWHLKKVWICPAFVSLQSHSWKKIHYICTEQYPVVILFIFKGLYCITNCRGPDQPGIWCVQKWEKHTSQYICIKSEGKQRRNTAESTQVKMCCMIWKALNHLSATFLFLLRSLNTKMNNRLHSHFPSCSKAPR